MINVKFGSDNQEELGNTFNKVHQTLRENVLVEKKYFIGNGCCIYKIIDFVGNEEKIFVIAFYYEKTLHYDVKQNFLLKLIKDNSQITCIMENVGYIFITDLFVKSFSFFWNEVFSEAFKNVDNIYKNF
ncbi:MAG: hypothetical protein ABDH21_03355 [bacterium]